MNWATVSSRPFYWLYRVFPSLAAKNIINLNLVSTIWWCSCVQSSLVLLEESVCYDQCILLTKLYYLLPCFILYSKAKYFCYSRGFLTSYFCIPVLHNEKHIFFWVLVLKGLVGLHRNSAMATGLEKVSFHSNSKERQCQRMLKLPHNCTHLTSSKVMLKILQARLQQ